MMSASSEPRALHALPRSPPRACAYGVPLVGAMSPLDGSAGECAAPRNTVKRPWLPLRDLGRSAVPLRTMLCKLAEGITCAGRGSEGRSSSGNTVLERAPQRFGVQLPFFHPTRLETSCTEGKASPGASRVRGTRLQLGYSVAFAPPLWQSHRIRGRGTIVQRRGSLPRRSKQRQRQGHQLPVAVYYDFIREELG